MRNMHQMYQKNLAKLAAIFAIIIIGLLSIGVGLIVALVAADPKWLYISLGGILLAILGVGIIVFEIKRIKKLFKSGMPPEMQEILRRARRKN